jgi:poly(3-hydroxybutyrate) depolymerase
MAARLLATWPAALLAGAALVACASDGEESAVSRAEGASAGMDGSERATSNEGASATEPAGAEPSVPGSSPSPGGASEALDPDAIGNVPASGQGGSATAAGDGTRVAPVPSSGCGRLALIASGEQTLDVDGVERTYVLDVPAGYDGNAPLPLVFAFHGATTSGALFRSAFYGNLLSTMQDAAIVVHPDALGDPSAWNNDADIPFFDALLAELGASACVDEARVFATGHSSGGFFTNALGCQRGDVLRAIAPVSAGGPFTFGGNGCSGEVAVWLAHAENDETVPFDTGVDSRDRWLASNGCSEATEPVDPSPCVEYGGCGAGLPVRWCVYQDGHDWPDFGPEGIWGFFSSF